MLSVQTNEMTRAIAVQPTCWDKFDPIGCEWAIDMRHAFQIGKNWGDPCMIWMCPEKGEPIKWCRCDENTDAIADLVFGC